MRTNERSYLQSIGFQDEDRGDALHDLACLYIAQDAKLIKLAGLLGPSLFVPGDLREYDVNLEESYEKHPE